MATTAKDMPVRVRIAPSPTGHWHLGGVRTALFNWLFAKNNKGAFVLRVEDTDKERSEKKYESEIIEVLDWLGLDWDEGPGKGKYGPYRQSERVEIYKKHLEKLLEEGKAYYCYCSKEELEAERQAKLAEGLPPKYSGHCRNLSNPHEGVAPELIRFKTPETKVEFEDIIRGKVSFDASLFGDIIIAKNLESPLYNFAAVVDDELMEITHVIRGEEHLSNTPKQILIQKALGFKTPKYAHAPLILATDKSKLSKRDTEASILSYRDEGYLPEAIINFLALLGWHPSGDEELFSKDELVKRFDLRRVQKSGAVLNREKLDRLNQHYLKQLTIDELAEQLAPFLKSKGLSTTEEALKRIVLTERDRMKTLGEFTELADFFFKLPDYDPKLLTWQNDSLQKTKDVLAKTLETLDNVSESKFKREEISESLKMLIEEQGRGTVLWPLRAALSGKSASPDPLEIAEVLGKKESTRRVEEALHKIDSLTS